MKSQDIRSFGSYLRKERRRLGMTQPELSAVGGVSKTTQVAYEAGTPPEMVDYLQRISAVGVDTGLLLTGESASEASQRLIEWDLVGAIVEAISEWEQETGLALRTGKRGTVIRHLYRQFSSTGGIDASELNEVLKLAA